MRALLLLCVAIASGHVPGPYCPEGAACPAGSPTAYVCDEGYVSPAGSTRCCRAAGLSCPAGTAVDGDTCGCVNTRCERPGDALVIAPRATGLVCLPDIRDCGAGMALEQRSGTCMPASQVTCEAEGAMLWVKRAPHPAMAALSWLSFLCVVP